MHHHRRRMPLILFVTKVLLLAPSAFGDELKDYCGQPPPVADETLKGEIEGQAQFLSRFLGGADLSGEIETSRKEIFSRYPDAEGSRSNAFFEYQVCVHLMKDDTLSTRDKIDELIRIRREFAKPVAAISDENDYFRTDIISAAKSPDGKGLVISATIQSKNPSDFLMSYMNNSSRAVDNNGIVYGYPSVSGIRSSGGYCGQFSKPDRFNLITPQSRQNLIFTFRTESASLGDRVNFSSNFCIRTDERVFSLPVGISNIRPDSARIDNQEIQNSKNASCTSSASLRRDEWAEFKKVSNSFSWRIDDANHPCLIIHSDTNGDKRGCPGEHVSISAGERLWFRTENGSIDEDSICFEGLQFVRYCYDCN